LWFATWTFVREFFESCLIRHCENSDLIGQTLSDHAKNGLCKSTVGGRPPETLSWGIKRTAGSHPQERVSGGLPRVLADIRIADVRQPKSSAGHSALSAASLNRALAESYGIRAVWSVSYATGRDCFLSLAELANISFVIISISTPA
jgi:hypothetical protein